MYLKTPHRKGNGRRAGGGHFAIHLALDVVLYTEYEAQLGDAGPVQMKPCWREQRMLFCNSHCMIYFPGIIAAKVLQSLEFRKGLCGHVKVYNSCGMWAMHGTLNHKP